MVNLRSHSEQWNGPVTIGGRPLFRFDNSWKIIKIQIKLKKLRIWNLNAQIIWIPKKPKFDIRQSKISGFQRNAIRKPLKFRKRLFVSWLDIIVMELSIKQFWRSLLKEAISHDRILVRIWPKIFTMTNINNWTLPKIYLQHMLAHALHEIRPRLVRTYLR